MQKTNWVRNIITALISIAVTVIAGLILYYFQTKEPSLEYSVEKILPFESQSEKLNIYHVTIVNSGNSVAEDITCKIQIVPATIKEYRINSEAPIQFTDSLGKQDIDIATNTLNPQESYRVSILATSSSTFPEKPLVKLRAKGITAVEKIEDVKDEKQEEEPSKYLALLAAIAATASTLTLLVRKKLNSEDKSTHSGDQNEIIAYLCGIHGLKSEIERFLTLPRTSTYWAEMDRFASIAISLNEREQTEKIIKIVVDLIDYASMADSSKGIGYYNLARLYKSIGDLVNSDEYLDKANKLIPKLLNTRKKLDPLFNSQNN